MRIALDLVIRVFRREQWFVFFFIDSRLYLFDFNSKLTTHSADTLLLMLAAMLVTIDGAIATVSVTDLFDMQRRRFGPSAVRDTCICDEHRR